MYALRSDLRRDRPDRCRGVPETPADNDVPARTRVSGPLAAGTVVVAASAGLAVLTGLPVAAVVAVTAVVGVAAAVAVRGTLSSLAAGAGLRLARPYCPGEHVRLFVPEFDRAVEAEIVRVGLANTTLMTSSGLLVLPNSRMVRDAPEHRAA